MIKWFHLKRTTKAIDVWICGNWHVTGWYDIYIYVYICTYIHEYDILQTQSFCWGLGKCFTPFRFLSKDLFFFSVFFLVYLEGFFSRVSDEKNGSICFYRFGMSCPNLSLPQRGDWNDRASGHRPRQEFNNESTNGKTNEKLPRLLLQRKFAMPKIPKIPNSTSTECHMPGVQFQIFGLHESPPHCTPPWPWLNNKTRQKPCENRWIVSSSRFPQKYEIEKSKIWALATLAKHMKLKAERLPPWPREEIVRQLLWNTARNFTKIPQKLTCKTQNQSVKFWS